MEDYQQLLIDRFHLEQFRPGQEAVIQALLAGRSSLAVFPTGSGKSLCYQLSALLLDGLTLVVSPLIALMKDQVDQLHALNIPAARLDSSLSNEEVQAIYHGLQDDSIKLLYVSPERLSNERFVSRLRKLRIALMAVDEAHCISEWGHNFRPDYLKLTTVAKTLQVERVLALTATATPAVSQEICQRFNIAAEDYIQTGFYRPNLALQVKACRSASRNDFLYQQICSQPDQPTIVYVTLQKTAEKVATFLSEHDCPAQPYHAGLKDELRHQVQDNFMSGQCNIVVATIAFGMGIDKANIRAVYHYNLPKSLENYMQEVGRAGRDGLPSHCELLASSEDLTVLENFIYGDTPDSLALQQLIEHLLSQGDIFDIANYELANQFDVRPLVIGTLLTYLELERLISATAPFYNEYKVKFLSSSTEIMSHFNSQRAQFLQALFTSGKQGRIWLTLKPADAAEQLGEDQQRITKALNYLQEQGLIELKVAGARQGYRVNQQATDIAALSKRMTELFAQREARDIRRLQQVCEWICSDDCHQRMLLEYFGETLTAPCGKCSSCTGNTPIQLGERQTCQVDQALIKTVTVENHPALKQPRQLARFLCGISSPCASRARLGKNPHFGALAESPFAEVLQACIEALN